MKTAKSEQHIKFSINKYQNYFTEKNWKDAMYMDDRGAEKPDLEVRIKNTSSTAIQPRTRLSFSLSDKAGAVLSDPRKMGMLQKVQNSKTRKSIAKISYTSTLPPIKTQTLETSQYLNKLKNELNDVSLKTIQLQKQVSQMKASTNITKQRIIAFRQQLQMKKQKQQKEIQQYTQSTVQNKYTFQVRTNMVQNLKTDIRALTKRNNNLETKLKTLKTELNSASAQLDNNRKSINNNIYNKKLFETRQELRGEEFRYQSLTAQKKFQHEKQAQKIHQKLQNIQKYGESQYKYETNLQNHFKILNDLRVQQVMNGMMNLLFNKSQAEWHQYERSYSLMKMYSLLNNTKKKDNFAKSQSFIQNKSNISLANNNSVINPQQPDSQINVVKLYEESFTVKQQLKQIIKEKQSLQIQLEKKKQILYKRWIQKTFEEPLTDSKRQTDFSKQIKKLYEKQRNYDRCRRTQQQMKNWERKQQEVLGLRLSKKIPTPERFLKILQYLLVEVKKFKKVIEKEEKQTKLAQTQQSQKTKNKQKINQSQRKQNKYSWA